MTEQQAVTMLRDLGYRVTKPRAKKQTAPLLNAVGKPFGANYDPNYRVKMPKTSIKRLLAPMPRSTQWVREEHCGA